MTSRKQEKHQWTLDRVLNVSKPVTKDPPTQRGRKPSKTFKQHRSHLSSQPCPVGVQRLHADTHSHWVLLLHLLGTR